MKWDCISKPTRERPDSAMPFGVNVAQPSPGVEGPLQLAKPHRCGGWCYGDRSSWRGSNVSLLAHNLTSGHPRPGMGSWEVKPPELPVLQGWHFFFLPGNSSRRRHQMLIFSREISLSDWVYHLFPSPWAIVGWTSFVLNSSAWNLLFCAAGSQLCKSLPTPSLPPEGVVGLGFFFFFFNIEN